MRDGVCTRAALILLLVLIASPLLAEQLSKKAEPPPHCQGSSQKGVFLELDFLHRLEPRRLPSAWEDGTADCLTALEFCRVRSGDQHDLTIIVYDHEKGQPENRTPIAGVEVIITPFDDFQKPRKTDESRGLRVSPEVFEANGGRFKKHKAIMVTDTDGKAVFPISGGRYRIQVKDKVYENEALTIRHKEISQRSPDPKSMESDVVEHCTNKHRKTKQGGKVTKVCATYKRLTLHIEWVEPFEYWPLKANNKS